jgi:hypothetical protein
MKINTSILTLSFAVILTGCNEVDTSQRTNTVGWYLDHQDELAAALSRCGDNPGEFAKTPNCINANEARNKITVQEMEDALK